MKERTEALLAVIALLVFLWFTLWAAGMYDRPKKPEITAPAVSTGDVVFDVRSAHCVSQPFGTKQDGWRRLGTEDLVWVDNLVKRGKAEKYLWATLKCRDSSKSPVVDFYLKELWWRRIPAQYDRRACGDYTRPDVPYPVVVGV